MSNGSNKSSGQPDILRPTASGQPDGFVTDSSVHPMTSGLSGDAAVLDEAVNGVNDFDPNIDDDVVNDPHHDADVYDGDITVDGIPVIVEDVKPRLIMVRPGAGDPTDTANVPLLPDVLAWAAEAHDARAARITAAAHDVRQKPIEHQAGPQAARQRRISAAAALDVQNLLCGVAWFGEVSVAHVQALWLPQYRFRYAQSVLGELMKDKLLSRRMHTVDYVDDTGAIIRKRYGYLWSLSDAGMEFVSTLPTFPRKYVPPRTKRMIAHDIVTIDTIAHMLVQARSIKHYNLSGVYLERESRLNPPHARPIMDAAITLRLGGEPTGVNTVPWINDPPELTERLLRYAIENDRDSEPIPVIIGKADAYMQAARDWKPTYGRFPTPLWIVPSRRRLFSILNAWGKTWRDGKWLMTTDDDLVYDRWVEFHNGGVRERRLFNANTQFVPFVPDVPKQQVLPTRR